MKTTVHFRKWFGGEIIALFPELPHDPNGVYCISYEQVGQHGASALDLPNTVPATPREYDKLAKELTAIGYDLRLVARITAKMHSSRVRAAIAKAEGGAE